MIGNQVLVLIEEVEDGLRMFEMMEQRIVDV